jgi:hypothetical protein
MMCRLIGVSRLVKGAVAVSFAVAAFSQVQAQSVVSNAREFRPGAIARADDVPASRLRSQLDRLPAVARTRAAAWLNRIHFTELDLKSMRADSEGGIFYADSFTMAATAETAAANEPSTAQASVALNPFPAGLIFHSRPGAPNVIYLNFTGESISNTAWNTSENRSVFQATAFSTDSDFNSFSDAEQTAIKRIWERVSEDYAPFNVDVTTERPAVLTTRTAMALITRHTDSTGADNPASDAGGVAYINVFGNSSYANYRPAWIYYDNLASSESFIAEATSHEIGHNMGLSHDGQTGGLDYYGGHGSGQISWGPIMGTGYNRNVSQWCKGEYYLANNTQDDLAVIASKLSYNLDDHGDDAATATPLVLSGRTNIVSTTLETDPANSDHANKGTLQQNNDTDVFSFNTGAGIVNLTVNPWIMPSGFRGGNLDVSLELRDEDNQLVATNNPETQTGAQIQTTLRSGTYYLFVRNSAAGNPLSSTPTGYTSYGSIGQYFISGYVASPEASAASVLLTTAANNPDWGVVSPDNTTVAVGNSVQIQATPAPYFRFVGWTNGASGTDNPLTLTVNNDTTIEAVFSEILTTNSPTPIAWLVANGYANDFENVVNQLGANGIPLWQSYVAGLNPNDATDQLRLTLNQTSTADVLKWNTVEGRVYTLLSSTNFSNNFTPVAGAIDLPAATHSVTNATSGKQTRFYRIEVRQP